MTKKKQKHRKLPMQGEVRDREQARSALHKLRKAWKRASESERQTFLAEVGLQIPASSAIGERHLIADGRYLLPNTIKRIETIMVRRRLSQDAFMEELGFPGEGKDLVRALAKGRSLRLRVIAALDEWLTVQEQGDPMQEKRQIDLR
ncbi:hypothetical protein [Pseudorhizobium flavum]|uniref:Uncharacterized protein n=1 Tax=Pseudorhizobium flavum TaxID=1335061 RepID=A0A7W9YZM6_9HYPH|nr:hypothetical protein [Pseudorhizobium flavum]MBB6181330.1 hypothetical protein [Pseudorhizobium flavum]CAD6618354.1 hypothetical protein RFYW14_03621 [Pseudorhizobium flavum]